MDLIQHVQRAVEETLAGRSKLNADVTSISGFTSATIQRLLNNLGNRPGTNYLEVGVHKGATFVGANFGNEFESSTAVDNWSEFDELGQSFNTFNYNMERFLKPGSFKVLDQDCFSVDVSELPKINYYLYDGHHSEEAQYRALEYFYPALDDTFIFVVDDWNWPEVQIGTAQSIVDLGLKVLYAQEFSSSIANGLVRGEGWWNGLYVGVLSK